MASIIDEIKNKVDIVEVISSYIDLQKKGKNYWGLCPFHEDNSPSMSVSQEKQFFKCFVCGHGGNVINFVSDYEKISFGKTIQKLGEKVGIKVDNTFDPQPKYNDGQVKMIAALNDANNFFQYAITLEDGKKALDYAESRGLDSKIREKFAIGFSPDSNAMMEFLKKKGHDEATLINASLVTSNIKPFFKNRLIFALKNQFGDVTGFSGRLLEGEGPKYINSGESRVFDKSSILYNINNAYDMLRKEKEIYICEGYMDVIALHKAGVVNAVAIMGTALTEKHIPKLKNVKVSLMLDSDKAGVKATLKSIKTLLKFNISTFVVYAKGAKDPDEIFNQFGKTGLLDKINSKVPALQYAYAAEKAIVNTETSEGMEKFIETFSKYLSNASDFDKDFYVNKLSNDFGITKETISAKIPRYKVSYLKLKKKENEKKIELESKKYSYILIRSMLKKPMLIDVLMEHPAHFTDSIILGIAKYLVAYRQGSRIKLKKKYQDTIIKIQKDSDEAYETEKEFLDLINNINKSSQTQQLDSYNVKLSKATTSEDRLNYLQQLKNIKKGRK